MCICTSQIGGNRAKRKKKKKKTWGQTPAQISSALFPGVGLRPRPAFCICRMNTTPAPSPAALEAKPSLGSLPLGPQGLRH